MAAIISRISQDFPYRILLGENTADENLAEKTGNKFALEVHDRQKQVNQNLSTANCDFFNSKLNYS